MTYPENFDEVFNALGKYGRWQMLRAVVLALGWIHAGHSILTILVIGYTPKHWCKPENGTDDGNRTLIPHGTCELIDTTTNETSRCLFGYEYNIPTSRSLVSELDLVCDRNYIIQTSQMIYILGQAVGGYLVTIPADRFGRKITYRCAYLLFVVSGVAKSFAPDVDSFIALMFVNGLAQMGFATILFVQIIEMFPTDVSHYLAVISSVMWDVGGATLALIAYAFQNVEWRYVHLMITLISTHVIVAFWFLDESVRWLYANGRHSEAYSILQKVARTNKVDMAAIDNSLQSSLQLIVLRRLSDSSESSDNSEIKIPSTIIRGNTAATSEDAELTETSQARTNSDDGREKLSFLVILRHIRLRRHFFIMCFIWPTVSLTYYGIALMVNQFAGDRIINLCLSAVVPLASKPVLFLIFFLNRFGRRKVMTGAFTLCIVVMVTAAVLTSISGESMTSTGFMFLGKAAISASFVTIWIYTPELYPTNLRSLGLGSATCAARVGAMVAPFFGYMAIYIPWGPAAISAVLCLVSALLVCLLPETWKKPLAQTLPDIDAL